jgi:hypothetical protein
VTAQLNCPAAMDRAKSVAESHAPSINTRKEGDRRNISFITNLTDRRKWSRQVLLKIYTARWDIETAFREMKMVDQIEGFTTRSDRGVRQEIAAYMIARLLIGLTLRHAMAAAEEFLRWNDEHRPIANYVTLVDATRDVLLALVTSHQESALHVFGHAMVVIQDAAQRMRPHRSFERKCRGR